MPRKRALRLGQPALAALVVGTSMLASACGTELKKCSTLTAYDARTGDLVWTDELRGGAQDRASLNVTGDGRLAGVEVPTDGGSDTTTLFDVRTGKRHETFKSSSIIQVSTEGLSIRHYFGGDYEGPHVTVHGSDGDSFGDSEHHASPGDGVWFLEHRKEQPDDPPTFDVIHPDGTTLAEGLVGDPIAGDARGVIVQGEYPEHVATELGLDGSRRWTVKTPNEDGSDSIENTRTTAKYVILDPNGSSDDERLRVVDRATGASRTLDVGSLELVDDDEAIIYAGELQRISLATSAPLWSTGPIDDWAIDNRAVFGTRNNDLVALDLGTGDELWKQPAAKAANVIGLTDTGVLTMTASEVVAYRKVDGTRAWARPWGRADNVEIRPKHVVVLQPTCA